MGYDVHITRSAEGWWESEAAPITLDEWKEFVEQDAEMRLDSAAEATSPAGETIRVESEGLAVWTAYSGHGVGGNMAWFDWRHGKITVKNPDPEILGKMFKVAQALNAKVQGDEEEYYGEEGKPV